MPATSKIPPKVLIVIGIAVIAASVSMNLSRGYQRFTLFIVAGVITFLYGVFRFFTDKGEDKARKVAANVLRPQQHMHYNRQPEHGKDHHKTPRRRFCPFCAAPQQPNSNYCSNCGNRISGI